MQYLILSALSSFPKACADTERGPPHDGDPVPAGGCGFRAGQSVFLHLQRTQGSIPEHQRAQGTLPVELHRWYVRVGMSQMMHHFVSCPFPDLPAPLSAALFGALGVLCFLAAVRHHSLTERVANFREHLFVLVVLDDSLDWSFWLGVGSIATHFAVCGVVAMSRIKLPKPEIKKPEEPTVSAVDLLY